MVVKISGKRKPEAVRKSLGKLSAKKPKLKTKKLSDFYGALPNTYEDGLTYQKKQRDEWR